MPYRMALLLLLGVSCVGISPVWAIDVCGSICDVVWTSADSPVLATCNLVVPAGCTLIVEAGVEVLFDADAGSFSLSVDGSLEVNGTQVEPVTFMSDAATPIPGHWVGVQLLSGSSIVNHASIAHAVVGINVRSTALGEVSNTGIIEVSQGIIVANSASASLSNVTVTQAGIAGVIVRDSASAEIEDTTVAQSFVGIEVRGNTTTTLLGVTLHGNTSGLKVLTDSVGAPTIYASDCTFIDNAGYGIGVFPGFSGQPPSVTVTASSIHSNLGDHDFEVFAGPWVDPAQTILWAADCWWGTDDLFRLQGRIFDHEDDMSRPRVYYRDFGETCAWALGADQDRDAIGDFEDNCPMQSNGNQIDGDDDLMGDACDPEPDSSPSAECDGIDDSADGYVDSDGDGWGDPCDFQPTRDDSYPGAPEICDGRDNDGDAVLPPGEATDQDFDKGVACGDCDDLDPQRNTCACESCSNTVDDDCDGFVDATDPNCEPNPYCILLTPDGAAPALALTRSVCSGESVSGPFDVLRGTLEAIRFSGGSVDLGPVTCVADDLFWDRVTDFSPDPGATCSEALSFYLAKGSAESDYGAASSGERRGTMEPDPACP